MTAAEAGVRLEGLLLRFPDLLAGQGGRQSAQFEGEGSMPCGRVTPKRELLPLLLPRVTLLRSEEHTRAFPLGKEPDLAAKKLGAEAWQYVMIAALNNLDSHGNCVSFFGPPTTAQARALSELSMEGGRLFADVTARTPTDFKKELGCNIGGLLGRTGLHCPRYDFALGAAHPTRQRCGG